MSSKDGGGREEKKMNDAWDVDFCIAVIDASLYWTGEDEALCPALKYLRSL